ncbi:MAG TPA: hypothetical protein VHE80_12130 [Acidimicrobiales bacterium]|nr:hypothetical protein [Acidimicrobiales bacterium]
MTALTGVSAAAAAGVLPDPAQRVVANAVEAVTPFELPEAAPGRAGAAPVPPTTVPVAAGAPTVGSDPPPVVPPSAAGGSEPSVPAAPAPPPEQPAPAPAPAPAGPTTGIGGSWTCQTTPGAAQSGTWGGSTTNQRSTWPSGGYGDRSNLWGTSGTAQCWSFGDWDSWWESNEGGGSGLRSSKRGWALARPDR